MSRHDRDAGGDRALLDAELVYMAVPRLALLDPFFLLDPDHLADTPRRASSIKGASASARAVAVTDLEPVDLVVTGCVAVARDGVRLGKGGGFSDLEFAIASEAGLIGTDTLVATTVHPAQLLPAGTIPSTGHDMAVDLIVTPHDVVEVERPCPRRPGRIVWDELTDAKIAAIPMLQRLRNGGDTRGTGADER